MVGGLQVIFPFQEKQKHPDPESRHFPTMTCLLTWYILHCQIWDRFKLEIDMKICKYYTVFRNTANCSSYSLSKSSPFDQLSRHPFLKGKGTLSRALTASQMTCRPTTYRQTHLLEILTVTPMTSSWGNFCIKAYSSYRDANRTNSLAIC